VTNESGELVRKLHCYVVFTDHAGACQAKHVLRLTETAAVLAGAADVMRVRFCKPQNVTALCTPTFRTFVTAQWAQSAAVAKASPEYKKALCRVNALFVSKLHQHITTARLNSLFGKFGPMIACEVQYHSDGRSAGHGVVIYETIEDAEKALVGTNGYRLEGRTIEVGGQQGQQQHGRTTAARPSKGVREQEQGRLSRGLLGAAAAATNGLE
jgi:hypothetical protein